MTGHIRRQGENTWELKFDLESDPLTGKRQTRYHTFKGRKREAQIKLAQLISEASEGKYIDASKLTLDEFLDRWERDWAAVNVSPKTLERYNEIARMHVRPHLGAARLQRLKPVHFAELYSKLLREDRKRALRNGEAVSRPPLSARTVGHVHRLLHRAMGHAVTWGLISINPVSAADPPPVEGTEIEILSAEQVCVVRKSSAADRSINSLQSRSRPVRGAVSCWRSGGKTWI